MLGGLVCLVFMMFGSWSSLFALLYFGSSFLVVAFSLFVFGLRCVGLLEGKL